MSKWRHEGALSSETRDRLRRERYEAQCLPDRLPARHEVVQLNGVRPRSIANSRSIKILAAQAGIPSSIIRVGIQNNTAQQYKGGLYEIRQME